MQKRPLGNTGEELSVVGFGGIAVTDETTSEASRLVEMALDRGINYFDVAPTYGNAQEMLGPALQPHRDSVFLACKSEKRTAEAATAALQESLRLLRTDHFDLFQLHAVATLEDVEQILAPGGAMEVLLKAREMGQTRFLGFSAHSEEAALALMDSFDFDTILFPVNFVCWYGSNFGPRVMDRAVEKNMGILALKSLARRVLKEGERERWPKCWYNPFDTPEEISQAIRFTLSRPVTAAVTPGHEALLQWACDAADAFEPLSAAEEEELAQLSQGLDPIFPLRET